MEPRFLMITGVFLLIVELVSPSRLICAGAGVGLLLTAFLMKAVPAVHWFFALPISAVIIAAIIIVRRRLHSRR